MKFMTAICMAFAAGIWCAGYYLLSQALLLCLLLIIFLANSWCLYKQHKAVIYAVILLFFILGILRCIQAGTQSPLDISIYHEKELTVYGDISEVPESRKDGEQTRIKYVVDVQTVEINGKTSIAKGRTLVYTRQLSSETIFHYGDKVAAYGQVFLLHGYNNPGLVDSAAALKRQGVTARMSVSVLKRIERTSYLSDWPSKLALWREKISGLMRSVMPDSDAAILKGMLFGGV